jgi:uncharacterized protein (TIGR02302 family)
MSQKPPPFVNRVLERKVARARWAGLFEQLWLRFWIVGAVAAVFAVASFAGLWETLSKPVHIAVLAGFAIAALAGLFYAGPLRWLTRDEALRRIEAVSGIPHRPASSYEDTLSSTEAGNPATATLWAAHRVRMLALLQKLRVGPPRPRTHRFDPYAVRSLLVLGVIALAGLNWGSISERLKSAFSFGPGVLATARLDAWVSPPPYTARPPVMLADGAKPLDAIAGGAGVKPAEVPVNSTLIARLSGVDDARLALEVLPEGAKTPVRVEPQPTKKAGLIQDAAELRFELKENAAIRVLSGSSELAAWKVVIIPDALPTIEMSKTPEVTARGSMKLTYKVKDDYGVSGAEAKVARVAPRAADPAKAWAQPEALKGPRWPKERPPQLTLKVPPGNTKEGEASTYIEFGSHPWSGQRVQLTLEAKDVAGQIGRSRTIEIKLPQRRFTKPLARAVIEQRAKLVEDHRYRDQVVTALDALTMEPEGFIDDTRIYLGLRTASYRLQGDRTRSGMKSVVKQLWDVALKIEDGDLSDAEKALREAQEKLSKLLEEGASEEEIKQAMQELRDAMNNYMEQLAKDQGDQQPFDGQNQDMQSMSQQDMQRMMDNLEEMAKNGSREEAQQMLSEMRDMMERMQQGKMDREQAEKNEEMLKLMDELGGVVGDQQKLMDETFKERREQGRTPRNPQQKDQQRFGAENNSGPQQRGDRSDKSGQRKGQRGQGEQGQQGGQAQGQGQQQPGEGDGEGQRGQGQEGREGLNQRQRALRDRLGQLQRGINEKGGQPSEQLEGAKESMQAAEDALERGDLEGATDEQARALDQMRQGAQQMAQEMMKNMPSRMGQNGDTPRDPLGRPQRSQGPDLGTAVKVPEQIDMQRAREILEELRRRLGDAQRPAMELDYLERLLKRF